MPKRKTPTWIDPKSGKEYYVCFIELPAKSDGKRNRKRIATLKEKGYVYFEEHVKAEKEKLKNELEPSDTLNKFFEKWISKKERKLKIHTVTEYRRIYKTYIESEIGSLKMNDITAEDITKKVIQKKRKLLKNHDEEVMTSDTAKRVLKLLKSLYKDALNEGFCTRNPVWGLIDDEGTDEKHYDVRPRSALSDDEFSTVVHCLNNHLFENSFDTLYVVLLSRYGLRREEACALTVGDVSLSGGFFDINKSLAWEHNRPVVQSPKSKKSYRAMPLLDEDAKYFRPLMRRKADDVPLFCMPNSKEYTKESYIDSRWVTHILPVLQSTYEKLYPESPVLIELKSEKEKCDEVKEEYDFWLRQKANHKKNKSSPAYLEACAKVLELREKYHDMKKEYLSRYNRRPPFMDRGMHEFRHTFATSLDRLGMSYAQKSSLMGDVTFSVVEGTYTHRDNLEPETVKALKKGRKK